MIFARRYQVTVRTGRDQYVTRRFRVRRNAERWQTQQRQDGHQTSAVLTLSRLQRKLMKAARRELKELSSNR